MKYAIDNEFLPKNNLTQQIEIKNKYGKRILREEKTPEELILDFFKNTDPAVESLRKRIKNREEKDIEIISEMRSYIQSPKYFLNVYAPGTRVPNKFYSYSNKDKFDPAKFIIKEIGRNNKIFDVINALKQEIHDTDADGEEIITSYTTEIDIIEFFKNHGVKELVIIDLSCSIFSSYQGDIPTPRTTRLIRKRITTHKIGGRRRRHKHTYKHKR
jgi:hypothetical protein